MQKRLHRFRHVFQLASMLLTLIVDALRYLDLCLHPSPALAAENLFLRKQLALYQERKVTPRRATNATRIALVWLGGGLIGDRPWPWDNPRPSSVGSDKPFGCCGGGNLVRDAPRSLRRSKPSSARWLVTTRRGARSALPVSCCSSSVFGYRHEPCASTCRSIWAETPASACRPSADQRLCATMPRQSLRAISVWQLRRPFGLGPGIPQPPASLPVPRQAHRHRLPAHLRVRAHPILGGLHHEYQLAAAA